MQIEQQLQLHSYQGYILERETETIAGVHFLYGWSLSIQSEDLGAGDFMGTGPGNASCDPNICPMCAQEATDGVHASGLCPLNDFSRSSIARRWLPL